MREMNSPSRLRLMRMAMGVRVAKNVIPGKNLWCQDA